MPDNKKPVKPEKFKGKLAPTRRAFNQAIDLSDAYWTDKIRPKNLKDIISDTLTAETEFFIHFTGKEADFIIDKLAQAISTRLGGK